MKFVEGEYLVLSFEGGEHEIAVPIGIMHAKYVQYKCSYATSVKSVVLRTRMGIAKNEAVK